MIITYFDGAFVKVQFGDTILAFNPISKESDLQTAKFGADIVLSSINHPDMNGIDQVTFGDKKPFSIIGPGEYEIGGVFVKGHASTSNYGNEKRLNTIYTVSLEGMNICFLGALNTPELPKEADEAIDEVDVLFVPIGGNGTLEPKEAYKLAVSIEPKIIIPILYDGDKKEALKVFLKEAGENVKPETKITLKKKDLENKEADIIVLEKE